MIFFKRFIDLYMKKIANSIDSFFCFFFKSIQNNKRSRNEKYYLLEQQKLFKNYLENLNFEKNYGFEIDKSFILDLAFHTQVVYKKSKINIDHGRLLYTLLSNYINSKNFKDINIVEIGTARGFSSICMCKSLYDYGQNARIFTYDILPHNKKMFWNVIDDFKGKTSRKNLLKSWDNIAQDKIIYIEGLSNINLKKIYMNRIHFAFVDGSHYGHDIELEFKIISSRQYKGDLVIFDDYNKLLFPDLVKTLDFIISKYNYSKKIINSSDNRKFVIVEKI